jgi:hypothetical protein
MRAKARNSLAKSMFDTGSLSINFLLSGSRQSPLLLVEHRHAHGRI